jgi:hypothetical protein
MHIEVKTITLNNYCGFSKYELLWEHTDELVKELYKLASSVYTESLSFIIQNYEIYIATITVLGAKFQVKVNGISMVKMWN